MNHFRVMIIGAGAAGISAAARLLENGIRDLVILEAENRIGGRIFTQPFGDSFVEIGAQWIHGEDGNAVYKLASKHNLVSDSIIDFDSSMFFDSNGQKINEDICAEMFRIYWSILGPNVEHEKLKYNSGSLGEYFIKKFHKEVEASKIENNLIVDDRLKHQFLSWLEKLENSIDASNSWFDTSAKGHEEYWDCDGNILIRWNVDGYKNLFDLLTKHYPDPNKGLPVKERVLLNKEVVKIHWKPIKIENGPNVKVECSDGTTYTADRVIISVSLGVLKEQYDSLFEPALPPCKINSIKGLGFGTVNKIFLKFDQRWWPEGVGGFSFLWTEEDRQKFVADNGRNNWMTHVFGFYAEEYEPLVMNGWIVGVPAAEMESRSDSEVLDGCYMLLKRFVGKKMNVPRPVDVVRSKWFTNKNFRGSYSCRMVESDELNAWASTLAEPVVDSSRKPVLLFAGEATHEHFFSTVHGAVESGWREAERILSLETKKHCL